MSILNEELDFEDFFDNEELAFLDIVTPSGVERRINDLNSAWEALYNNYSNVPVVESEFKAWQVWRQNALDSWVSKWFATGTLNELDNWKNRYVSLLNKVPVDFTKVPSQKLFIPASDKDAWYKNPLVWVVGGIGIGALIYLFAKR